MPLAVGSAQKRKVAAESEQMKRARSLVAKGDFAGAIAIYDEAIKGNPTWAEVFVKRGTAFRLQGSLEKAIQDFDQAMAINPAAIANDRSAADAYDNHGQILATDLRPEDAIVAFEKALKIYPPNAKPYFHRAEARILVEDFAGAIEDLNIYLTKEKWDNFNTALALGDRSLAKRLLGHDDEARKDLDSIPNVSPELRQRLLLHVGEIEAQLMILRQLRLQQKKPIA
ncbi:MAG TPA: tetratricopeptide repeat protein [Pyrinomonadaceae bacterium]|nr:tetratricopeptide repeat protein [Pyrinomonadaceae bacterium]